MNRRIFQTLRLPGGCIQSTKGLEKYTGATQRTAPFEEEEEGKRKRNKEDTIVRK